MFHYGYFSAFFLKKKKRTCLKAELHIDLVLFKHDVREQAIYLSKQVTSQY